ncbi:MAG: TolC family protein [Pseudomonadota bacterium]
MSMRTYGRMFGALLTVLVFIGGLARCAFGEDLGSKLARAATLSDLISYAYRENPSIREAREAWRAVLEDYRLSTGYPDPELKFTYFPDPIETRLGPQDWSASLTQKIPFPGRLSQAGKVVEAEARIAHFRLDKTVRAVVASIKESFHELLYIRTAEKVVAQNLEILQHLRKVAETAFARDRATLMDMVRAQSQLGQLRYDELLLEELELTEKTRLNGLLNRPPDAKIGQLLIGGSGPLVFNLNELYRIAETNQDEIRIAEAVLQRAGAKADLATYENLPDFNLGVFYSGIGEPDVPIKPSGSGRDSVGVQVGVTIPLWFDKNRGRVERAQAEVRKAEAAKTVQINETRTKVHAIFFRLDNSRRLIELYEKELLPQAVKAMEIAESWYREGESTFSDFVETQSVAYNFQLSLARAMADYGKYLARLEQVAGQSLTKRAVGSPGKAGKGVK